MTSKSNEEAKTPAISSWGYKWLNQGGMSGEHEKKERNPEECQRSRGMAGRLEMGGRQALQTTSGSDQWTNSIRNKNYLPHTWRKTATTEYIQPLFLQILLWRLTITPQTGDYYHLLCMGNWRLGKVRACPAVTPLGSVKSQLRSKSSASRATAVGTRP